MLGETLHVAFRLPNYQQIVSHILLLTLLTFAVRIYWKQMHSALLTCPTAAPFFLQAAVKSYINIALHQYRYYFSHSFLNDHHKYSLHLSAFFNPLDCRCHFLYASTNCTNEKWYNLNLVPSSFFLHFKYEPPVFCLFFAPFRFEIICCGYSMLEIQVIFFFLSSRQYLIFSA